MLVIRDRYPTRLLMIRYVNKSKNKFGARKLRNAWGEFDSKAEWMRYVELLDMQRKGVISNLQRQVRYEIIPAITYEKIIVLKTKTKVVERVDEKPAHYTCDFQYIECGVLIIEDAKSDATRREKDYVLRRKLMKHLIREQNEVAGREVMRFNEWVSTKKKGKQQ